MKTALKVIGGIILVTIQAFLVKCTLIAIGTIWYYVDKYGYNDGIDRVNRIYNRGLNANTFDSISEKFTIKNAINYLKNKKK